MTKEALLEKLYDNNEAFYLMTRSVAMLGSLNSEPFDRDAQMLIDFIGKVFFWEQELIDGAADLILGDMMKVSLVTDYHALASAEMLGESIRENLILFEMKGRVIEEVNRVEAAGCSFSEQKRAQEIRSNMCYSSFHHKYEPRVKFSQIKERADGGEVLSTLQEALMLILGIGCKRSLPLAQRSLERLLIWGEDTAARILAYLWKREDQEISSFYLRIMERLNCRETLADISFAKTGGNDFADELCYIIAAIQSVVVRYSGKRDIDILFADVMNREDISFSDKIELIRRYKEGTWLNCCFKHNKVKKVGILQ